MTDATLNNATLRWPTLTEIVRRVTHAEMTAAAFALAVATKDTHSSAVAVVLVDSDQGDWLAEVAWVDADGAREDLDLPEGATSLAWHLYSEQVARAGVHSPRAALTRVRPGHRRGPGPGD